MFVVDPDAAHFVVSLLERAELRERELEVLRLRFGLTSGIIMTLEDIGKELKITRERVRVIESRAINKLLPLIDFTHIDTSFVGYAILLDVLKKGYGKR